MVLCAATGLDCTQYILFFSKFGLFESQGKPGYIKSTVFHHWPIIDGYCVKTAYSNTRLMIMLLYHRKDNCLHFIFYKYPVQSLFLNTTNSSCTVIPTKSHIIQTLQKYVTFRSCINFIYVIYIFHIYNVKKEMKCSGDFEILQEIVRDYYYTNQFMLFRFSSSFKNYSSISKNPATLYFLFNCVYCIHCTYSSYDIFRSFQLFTAYRVCSRCSRTQSMILFA